MEEEQGRLVYLPEYQHWRTSPWWKVMLIGLALYGVGITILALTKNFKLLPAVVLLGTFIMPVTYVTFFYNHRVLSQITILTLGLTFFYGGILGIFAAALLEPLFIRQLNFYSSFKVGLIEEFAKILGVLAIARHRRHDSEMDGLILGAAAGMGFASLESAGYAFVAFLHSQGNLSVMTAVTLIRGVLTPLGHGTWTAILAGVLFRESTERKFIIDWQVIGTYLFVSVLHGLWDGLPFAMASLNQVGIEFFIGELVVGGIGIFVLARMWREARRLQITRYLEAGAINQRRAA
ncbi:MAG: PrsW family intramembrane metalloprotease [Armatimonadota bacterium]|nr:PrsW family intramembrane metalloprotease [Armatimonadota bacterium]